MYDLLLGCWHMFEGLMFCCWAFYIFLLDVCSSRWQQLPIKCKPEVLPYAPLLRGTDYRDSPSLP